MNILNTNNMPPDSGEFFEDLLTHDGVRIERIVSFGDITPVGEWYDQHWGEWVLIISGGAKMTIQQGDKHIALSLEQGDYAFFPAHQKHRVEYTENPTVWLAVHFKN